MTDRVLVIEDDSDTTLVLQTVLTRTGFEVTQAVAGRAGLRAFHTDRPDLVVLDIGLADIDGWTVLERIRDLSDVPVLILTARGPESEKARAPHSWADDYLTKPFSRTELTARVQALLRRSQQQGGVPPEEIYDDGSVLVDFSMHEVRVAGQPVDLTPTEFRLLAALVRHRGQVLSPVKLLELAWSDPFGVGPDRVKYSVMRLRRKLGSTSRLDSSIEAIRGFGYRYRSRPAPLRGLPWLRGFPSFPSFPVSRASRASRFPELRGFPGFAISRLPGFASGSFALLAPLDEAKSANDPPRIRSRKAGSPQKGGRQRRRHPWAAGDDHPEHGKYRNIIIY